MMRRSTRLNRALYVNLAAALLVLAGCPAKLPPSAPSIPVGDSNATSGTVHWYSASATDPAGPLVALRFNWDDGDTSSWSSITYDYGVPALDSHNWNISGIFHVRAQAKDARDRRSDWSDSLEVTISSAGDEPPITPVAPLGPDSGATNASYTFRASTTDVDNDSLAYRFDWGAGDTSAWFGPIAAGETLSVSHQWTAAGTYEIRVQAEDFEGFGALSSWSPPHTIVIR